MIYKWIGMAVVKYLTSTIRNDVSTGTMVKAGVGTAVGVAAVTGIDVAAYVATRDVPEA